MASWEEAQTMLQRLADNASGEQDKLTALAAQQAQRGFRNPGQTGWEAITNPDEAQSRAMMDISLRMLGSDPRASSGAAIQDSVSKGLSLMDTMRERDQKQKMGAQALAVKGADKNFSRAIDIIDMVPTAPKPKMELVTLADGTRQYVDANASEGRTFGSLPDKNTTKTSVVEVEGRKILINDNTGETIKDLGLTSAAKAAVGQPDKQDVKKFTKLDESAVLRQNNIKKATDFLQAFESGAESGTSRKILGFLPGQFTDQGAFDEELDAFAEQAARAQLKAAGEIRPTDADVKGMKEALFGKGKGEQTNKNLLSSYLREQIGMENQYRALQGKGEIPVPTPESIGENWYDHLYGGEPATNVIDFNDLP